MAAYTGFVSPVRPFGPTGENADVWLVAADVILLDENDAFVLAVDEIPGSALVTLYSVEPLESSDDEEDLRRKVTSNLFANYDNLDPELDVITYKFM